MASGGRHDALYKPMLEDDYRKQNPSLRIVLHRVCSREGIGNEIDVECPRLRIIVECIQG